MRGFISDDNPAPQHSEGAAAALKRSMGLSATTKATQAQDMLICIEIVFAALALSSAFSYQDFTDDDRARRPLMASLAEVLDPQDLARCSFYIHLTSRTAEFGSEKCGDADEERAWYAKRQEQSPLRCACS